LAVTEPQRLALYRAAQAALGEEEGGTLMALTPPANTDIATRQDVEHWKALMSAQLAEMTGVLRAEAAETKGVLQAEAAETKGVLQAEIAETKGVLQADIARSAAELRAHTWKVVVGTGVALYLAMVGTAFAGFGLLLRILDVA
jgi:hypothetical protein